MPRKPQPWFRFYVEAFNDRKILRLNPAQRWLWVAILGAARQSPEPGALLVAEGEPMTTAELSRYADIPERQIKPALSLMERLQMIAVEGDLIRVTNWDNRQFESDNVSARTAAYRERHSQDQSERSYERSTERVNGVRRNAPEQSRAETEQTGGQDVLST
jgi:hypothetical protein